MIQYIQVTQPSGDTVKIELRSPEKSGFFIKNIDGLHPPNVNVIVSESPNVDGAIYNSSKMSQRNIVISLGFLDNGSETIETIRNRIYKFFPSKTELTIKIVTDTRTATTKGYVETNNINIFSRDQGSIISILCQDPFLYGEETFTLFNGTQSDFQFPFSNESLTEPLISFGTILQNTEGNIQYNGDQPVGVVVIADFSGPVTNPSFVNTSTGQTISISSSKLITLIGSGFTSGDRLIISTKRGSKYVYLVRNSTVYNIINTLGSFSDWFTLKKGDNVFVYIADSGVSNMLLYVIHSDLYEGV